MNLKMTLTWAGVAFMLWSVIREPQIVAHMVSNIGLFVRSGASGLSHFASSI